MRLRSPAALALSAFALLALGSSALWTTSHSRAERAVARRGEVLSAALGSAIEGCVGSRLEMVRTMVADLGRTGPEADAAYRHHAQALVETVEGFLAINLVDPGGVIVRVHPEGENRDAMGQDLTRNPVAGPVLAAARAAGAIRLTPPLELYQGGTGLATYAPIAGQGGAPRGFVNGVFRTARLFSHCLPHRELRDYLLEVRDRDAPSAPPVFAWNPDGSLPSGLAVPPRTLRILNRTWVLELTPTRDALRAELPAWSVLAGSWAVSALVGWLLLLLLRGREARADLDRARRAEIHRLGSIVETTGDFVALLELDGRVGYLNAAARALLGVSRPDGLHLSRLPAADPEVVRAHVARTVETGADHEDLVLRAATGAAVPVSFHTVLLRDPESGEPTGLATIGRDLRERRQLEGQLAQARKMEALGRLAGGVAHDFNNLLTVIGAALGELRASDPGGEARARLDEIGRAAERAADLTRRLLALGRRAPGTVTTLDLREALEDLRPLLRRLLRENVELELELGDRPLPLRADPVLIEQIVVNLATNGADAMPEGGRLRIEAFSDAHEVHLRVEDTGEGMDARTQARIFEPFFTTKRVGEGSGLGLATVYGHSQALGGRIELRSAPGEGTCFELIFPRADEAAVRSGPLPGVDPVPSGRRSLEGRRILLVEDEPAVRDAVRRLLERQGAVVREAPDGRAALRTLEQEPPDGLDLVLTDVVMPGLGGAAVLDWVAENRPGLPVVLSSGYTDSDVDIEAVRKVGARFLRKPYAPSELLRVLEEALAS